MRQSDALSATSRQNNEDSPDSSPLPPPRPAPLAPRVPPLRGDLERADLDKNGSVLTRQSWHAVADLSDLERENDTPPHRTAAHGEEEERSVTAMAMRPP